MNASEQRERAKRMQRLAGYGFSAAALGGSAHAKVIYHDIPDVSTQPYVQGQVNGLTIDLLTGDVLPGGSWGPALGQIAFGAAPDLVDQPNGKTVTYTRHAGRQEPVEMAISGKRGSTGLLNLAAGVSLAGPVFTGSGSTAGTSFPSLAGGNWGDSSFNDLGPFSSASGSSSGSGGLTLKHPEMWQLGERGFIAMRMDLGGRADTGTGSASSYGSSPNDDIIFNYAWIELTLNTDKTVTVHAFAYEDEAGEAIFTGQTPEPSSLALLAFGSVGVLARRRRG